VHAALFTTLEARKFKCDFISLEHMLRVSLTDMHAAAQTLLAYVFEVKIRITISITRDGVKDASGLLLIPYPNTLLHHNLETSNN
jgi:hypothetical protein